MKSSEMDFVRKNIFLIDGVGAIFSALMLGIVLPSLNTGMHDDVLRSLAGAAVIFGVYSLSCFFSKRESASLLRPIIVANSIYCLVTAVVVARLFDQLTTLAVAYFAAEIVVIAGLVRVELLCLQHRSNNTAVDTLGGTIDTGRDRRT